MENLNRRKCWLWFPIRFTFYEIEKKYDDIELKITSGLLSKKVEKIKFDNRYYRNDIGVKALKAGEEN